MELGILAMLRNDSRSHGSGVALLPQRDSERALAKLVEATIGSLPN